jgi:hypothetical protein
MQHRGDVADRPAHPDNKTSADFRMDSGGAIKQVCVRFIGRLMGLLTTVSVARYLAQLDTADLQEPSEELGAKRAHLKESWSSWKCKNRMPSSPFPIRIVLAKGRNWVSRNRVG